LCLRLTSCLASRWRRPLPSILFGVPNRTNRKISFHTISHAAAVTYASLLPFKKRLSYLSYGQSLTVNDIVRFRSDATKWYCLVSRKGQKDK
jgi:hypothetical protein